MSPHSQQHSDTNREEEEALSLCDLPINNCGGVGRIEIDESKQEDDLEFDFGSLIGSISALEYEMCSADEVFSGGQILPFRQSVSSDVGYSRLRNSSSRRSVSRSESMNHIESCSRSSSTRSNSIKSRYSITSNSSTTSSLSNSSNTTIKTIPIPNTKSRNNSFHSHPSPRPRVWASGAQSTTNTPTTTPKRSTMWEVLKLGLVRSPEIELQHHRTTHSCKPFIIPRSNSTSSNTSDRSINNKSGPINGLLLDLQNRKNQPQNKSNNNISGGFFKSCKCSVMVIEPLPSREFGLKSGFFGPKVTKHYQVLNEDKNLEHQQMKQQVKKDNKHDLRQGKKIMSHHRTFEWLRDLSHVNVLNS